MKRFIKYLLKDEMPIWLSILLALSAGFGAYFLAPIINKEIGYENSRTAHVTKTVDNLNQKIVELSKSIRYFNDSLFYGKKDIFKRREEVLDKITELQWLLIDVDAVIVRETDQKDRILELQRDLDSLNESVQNAKTPEDQENVITDMRRTAGHARALVMELYVAAKLK